MRLFCIGHKPPEFQIDAPFTFVSPVPAPGLQTMVVPDDAFGPAWNGYVLSEYTQLRALAEHLEREGSDEILYIFQYRRFIALREPPRLAENAPYLYAVRPREVPALFPGRSELAAYADARVVCPPIGVLNVAWYYSTHHHTDDFVTFTLALSEVEGFDRARCKAFASSPTMFPAPSLGIIRPERFVMQMKVLMSAWEVFYQHYYVPREGRQRRVGGFLLERLQSFLLLEELAAADSDMHQGYLAVVTETDEVAPTI